MREWHVEHMEKTVVKYVKGLSENASDEEKSQKIWQSCKYLQTN